MAYQLAEINERIQKDPAEFVEMCDANFHKKVVAAADRICENLAFSPIVFLSGPSGSGKTTTALKMKEELLRRGILSHTISLDHYFKTLDPETVARTPKGDIDFESPLCLDMDLINEHFETLTRGEEIQIPHFIFSEQRRSASRFTPLRLGKDEIAIFEGIHALNDAFTEKHPEATYLYISARSNVERAGEIYFRGVWMRLVRRIVRDNNFRGSDAQFTLKLWANVRRGEKLYISPYKHKADYLLDSSLAYEASLMGQFALPLLLKVPETTERFAELSAIMSAFGGFSPLDPSYIRPDSLMREFIGGSAYEY